MDETYLKIPFKVVPVEKFDKCLICKSSFSKIQWGWAMDINGNMMTLQRTHKDQIAKRKAEWWRKKRINK